MIVLWLIVFVVVVVSVLACASSFFTPAPFPLVCVVSSMLMCHHPQSHVLWCLCVLCVVRHVTCTVCGGWHSPTHCPAVLHPLCSSLSVPLSSTAITRKNTQGCGEKRGRKEWLGKERKRKKRGVVQKTSGKKGGKKRKRDYDTWCSQVVSNPSTHQARRGFTSLIRREVVFSSWYGRNSLFLSLSLSLCVDDC